MKKFITLIVIAVLAIILVRSFVDFYSELLWYRSMNYEETFWTIYTTEYVVGFVYFIVFWVIIGLNVWIASRIQPAFSAAMGSMFQQQIRALTKPAKLIFFGILLFISYVMSAGPATNWMRVLQFLHSEKFGEVDAVFSKDVGFYVYELSFYQSTINWLFALVVISILATGAVYIFKGSILMQPQGFDFGAAAKRHLMILISLIFALYVFDYHFASFDVLYNDNGIVVGASYTDVNALLVGYKIMMAVALIAMGLALAGAFRGVWKLCFGAVALQIIAAIILLKAYPAIIQKLVVTPNMLEKEKPYILENIKQTRRAYELDQIEERDFNYALNLTSGDIAANDLTIKNVTLWDYRPLRDAYSQLQEIRPYYNFSDIDVDRYRINNEYRQVMLAARELNLAKTGGNDNWINKTFIYTHGHGIVMSPVNVVTQEGQPEFFIKNIPPDVHADIKLDRPEIYFGEQQSIDDYVIIKTSKEEFDYPLGEANQWTFYKENAGVDIGSFGRKILFAIRFNKFNILLNDYIQSQSKVIYYRNIRDRVSKIAPFIRYDHDPYMVVADGRLYWIFDGFTKTDKYPYATMSYESARDNFGYRDQFNYIRNSVKVVIDAYNGQTTFYSFNPESDPLIRVYGKIFPGVFKPITDMPENLKSHLRYPQDLFDIQSRHYETYHIEDVNVFFNKEDIWHIPFEIYGSEEQLMESYYTIMRLPGEKKEEFILMIPYTPRDKTNMIAWMCVRNDGENYGKRIVYRFPKTELVYGPMQVEARIAQTPDISEKLSLWNQQGTNVTRGNLLVIPINNSLIYIEPLYLQSQQSKLPELKKVIVAYSNYIYMEDNLEIGLNKIFGGLSDLKIGMIETANLQTAVEGKNIPGDILKVIKSLSRSAMDNYNNAQDALKKGNWAKYGEELEKLRKDLERLVKESGGM